MNNIRTLKSELRRRLRTALAGITPERRAAASAQASALLRRQRVWLQAKSVLFYAPLADELDLLPLLEEALAEGRIVALPRYLPDPGIYSAFQIKSFSKDCAPGHFGVFEPGLACPALALKSLDLALVPGVGFDAAGHRLGRGKGYYDRILADVAGTRCGVGFDEQIAPEIPAEAHDIVLNCILTPTQWVETPGPRPAFS